MYKVWPCPLTRTVPTPGTLFALIVAEAADEAPAGALLPGESAAVLEDDEPHAAMVAAVPSARPPASSQLLSGPRRCLNLFVPIVPFISIIAHTFPQHSGSGFPSYLSNPPTGAWFPRPIGGAGTGLRAYPAG